MAIFRSFNDIVISFIEYLRLVQPELDTKPGTVSRDLFIDAPSQELANLYAELRTISGLQSLLSSSGTDLNRLASNFGATRGSGSFASGVATFTTNSLDSDILIPSGTIVTASNGINFRTTSNIVMLSSSANVYRANAARVRSSLDVAGITDEFSIDITVTAITPGTSGNIGVYSISIHNISGITNVTNLSTFSGGSNTESDAEFRTRVLSVFAGSNTGTELGYTTSISTISGIQDSIVIVPGDPLLIRDGTQVVEKSDGTLVVSEPGSGGKVDIYILGSRLGGQFDSFIYNDKSGKNDPTDVSNDYILGQRDSDSSLNVSQRRVELISADTLPFQPVDNIISVSGSLSGTNFIEQYTDDLGNIKGNYTLVKDSGDYGGSPFGFDKLRWISNSIEIDNEEVSKGTFNGVDSLSFSDITELRDIFKDELIVNENSSTNNASRDIVILKHSPVTSVSRVVNLTTGERYVIEDQNPNGTSGELNTTGEIRISGSTLPIATDILQVDYIWRKQFDDIFDFDNLKINNFARTTQDSVDWGFSNLVKNEPSIVVDDGYGNLTITVTHNIDKIVALNTFSYDISTSQSGTVTVNSSVYNVIDIRRSLDNAELFNTDLSDGTISGSSSIVLPTDSIANDNDIVNVRFNSTDIFSPDGYGSSTINNNIITLPSGFVVDNNTQVLVSYISSVFDILPESNISLLPAIVSDNNFNLNNNVIGDQPTSNILVSGVVSTNLREAASNIRVTVSGIEASGTVTLSGATRYKVIDTLMTVTSGSGYDIDVSSIILDNLGQTSLPSSVRVSKLAKLERVLVNNENKVYAVDNVYDIVNYELYDNSFDLNIGHTNASLSKAKFVLPKTKNNINAQLNTGDIVRITFYFINLSDSELLFFSRNGTQITDKVFQTIDKVSIGSGFKNQSGVLSGTILLTNFNQPLSNTPYDVNYSYVGPKENERITINFNHNELINLATTIIEDTRPITADVLIKEAEAININITISLVLLSEFETQSQVVIQDAVDAVNSFLNANSLGTTIDQSDVINTLYSVSGIDRVRILNFSTDTSNGSLLSISAQKNQYLRSGNISITVEDR